MWDRKGINGFDKRPQDAWPPRKLFSDINNDLKAKGIKPLTKEQLIDAYALIFNTDEEDLQELVNEKKVKIPYVLKLIIKELNNKNSRSKALADYRDYMFGKAMQTTENTTKVELKWNLSLKDAETMSEYERNELRKAIISWETL